MMFIWLLSDFFLALPGRPEFEVIVHWHHSTSGQSLRHCLRRLLHYPVSLKYSAAMTQNPGCF